MRSVAWPSVPSWDSDIEKPLSCRDFQILHPALLQGKSSYSSLGHLSLGLLLFRSLPGRVWRPAYAQLYTATCWRLLWMQRVSEGGHRGPPSARSRLGSYGQQKGGGSSCPLGRGLDCLNLLLCSLELPGKVLNCVAEESWRDGHLFALGT